MWLKVAATLLLASAAFAAPTTCPQPPNWSYEDPVKIATMVVIDHQAVAVYGEAKAKSMAMAAVRRANELLHDGGLPVWFEMVVNPKNPVKVLSQAEALTETLNPKGSISLVMMMADIMLKWGKALQSDNKLQHIVFFTGIRQDDFVPGDRDTLGIAPLNGMCTDTAFSIVRLQQSDEELAVTLAHELAHNLGLRHDGNNGCKKGQPPMMMTPVGAVKEKIWSRCSQDEAWAKIGCFGCLLHTNAKPRKPTSGGSGDEVVGPNVDPNLEEEIDPNLAAEVDNWDLDKLCDPHDVACWEAVVKELDAQIAAQ